MVSTLVTRAPSRTAVWIPSDDNADAKLFRVRLTALETDPETHALYAALSEAAVDIARRGGTDGKALGEITAALRGRAEGGER